MRKQFYIAYNIIKEYSPITSLYENGLFEVDFDNINNFICEGIITVGQEELLVDHVIATNRLIGRTIASLKLTLRRADERTLNQIKNWIGAGSDVNYNNFRKSGVIRKISEEGNVIREYALRGVCPESVKSPVSSYDNTFSNLQFEIEFFIESVESFIN